MNPEGGVPGMDSRFLGRLARRLVSAPTELYELSRHLLIASLYTVSIVRTVGRELSLRAGELFNVCVPESTH